MVRKEKERRQCKHYRHGLGKDVVLCSAPPNGRRDTQNPTFTYDSTPPELVIEFKHLGITLTRDGRMLTAAEKMADNFRSAIARVYRFGDSKGIKHRKHAMLWLFQV